MCQRKVSVGVNAPLQPSHRLGIRAELQFGCPHYVHPLVSSDITRREAECLDDMSFGLGRATQEYLRQTCVGVCIGRIAIKTEHLLEFRDPSGCAVCKD